MNAFQKSLHAQKIFITFTCDERILSFFARIMPAFRQQSRILRGVTGFNQLEAGFLY